MGKAIPSGRYVPEYLSGEVDQKTLLEYVIREHQRISIALEFALARNVEFLNAAPAKPREGLVCGADGTNWNPGSGKGVYAYYTGAWHLLG